MVQSLKGKRTLLTGASRGLGAHIARRMAEEGAALVLTARDGGKLDAVAGECRALGSQVSVIEADVSKSQDRERLVSESGELDILVNNAGVEITRRLTDQTESDVRAQLETNLTAPLELTRLALPGMLARGSGVVVNVSSMSGKGATPFNSIYAATKHGLVGFSKSLDIELHGTGVHVGVVCPGFVADAGMWADTGLEAPASLREVPLRKVVDAVMQVIDGACEVLVTPGPMRPLLALRELFPSAEGHILRAMGITRVLTARADRPK